LGPVPALGRGQGGARPQDRVLVALGAELELDLEAGLPAAPVAGDVELVPRLRGRLEGPAQSPVRALEVRGGGRDLVGPRGRRSADVPREQGEVVPEGGGARRQGREGVKRLRRCQGQGQDEEQRRAGAPPGRRPATPYPV